MEPLSFTASAIATLIFSKALEKGGEKLGEAISDKIGQLIDLIRKKFKKQGMEGALAQAETNPTEDSQKFFQQVLEMQMKSDSEFAKKLKTLMDELGSDEQVNQIIIENSTIQGGAEIGSVEQTTTRGGSVTQKVATGVEVGKDLKIGNVKQQS